MASSLRASAVNPFDGFQTIAQVGNLAAGIFVPANSPYQTIEQLVAAIRNRPGELRWAHTGRGSFLHIAGESFLKENDLDVHDVPFKGGSKVRAAVIGNQVDFGFIGINVGRGFESEMRALGVATPHRDPVMSDVPTFAESGLKYVDVSSPITLFAPKGVDPEIVVGMETALQKIAASDKFAELMLTKGNAPDFLTGADARKKLEVMAGATAPILDAIRAAN